MSIQSEIDRITSNVADAYQAVEDKGGTVPEQAVSNNLAAAIASIPAGESPPTLEVYSTQETVIGVWINGNKQKPVYRKVTTFTTDAGTGYLAVPGITNVDVLIEFSILTSGGNTNVTGGTLTNFFGLNNISCGGVASDHKIYFNSTNTQMRNKSAYAIAVYTKTSDAWQTIT